MLPLSSLTYDQIEELLEHLDTKVVNFFKDHLNSSWIREIVPEWAVHEDNLNVDIGFSFTVLAPSNINEIIKELEQQLPSLIDSEVQKYLEKNSRTS